MGPETTHRAPTSTSPNRFHSGGSVPPATQEEGITFHPLLTGTSEALRKLYVEDMPLVVIIDSEGNNLYEAGRAAYLAQNK